MIDFIKKHENLFIILGLLLFCYLIFFFGIGSYALMDIDETRYVLMSRDMFHSKDFMTLYLNGHYFFEKPPLYFWGEVLSFFTFGHVNEFTARFPVALYGSLSTLLLYFVGAKVVSKRYGIVSALILATSVEFLILAKYAILDIVLATCVEFALCFGFLTYFVNDKNKKYCWWAFYIFSGLAVLAKGIPGFVIPFGTMFFVAIFTKKFKELFRPQYFIVGSILFLLIVLPWHIIMLKTHNPLFFNEYIMKHHLSRFLDSSQGLNRKQPFYFFILTILWGFCPWIISAITIFINRLMKLKTEKFEFDIKNLTNTQKYLFFNFIAFVLIMLFFSSSSSKLVTYILPVYFALANLMAWGWVQYIENNKYEKPIKISAYIFFGILFTASILSLFTPLVLPKEYYAIILPVKWFTIALTFIFGLLGLIATKLNNRKAVFAMFVGFFVALSAFGIPKYFNLDYSFGQNDLMKYGKYARENNLDIQTINMGERYSLNYYGSSRVYYKEIDLSTLQNELDNAKPNVVFLLKNKYLKEVGDAKYTTIFTGAKYTLLKK